MICTLVLQRKWTLLNECNAILWEPLSAENVSEAYTFRKDLMVETTELYG